MEIKQDFKVSYHCVLGEFYMK